MPTEVTGICPCDLGFYEAAEAGEEGCLTKDEWNERKRSLEYYNFNENLIYPLNVMPLSNLFYCSYCDTVKCRRCCKEEIVSYFCPSCLFEAPSSTAVESDQGKCVRGCFMCPECETSLILTETNDAAGDGGTVEGAGKSFVLSCPCCRWDSKSEFGWAFPKAAGIASQLSKFLEKENAREQEVRKVIQHWEQRGHFFAQQDRFSGVVGSSSIASTWRQRLNSKFKFTKHLSSETGEKADASKEMAPEYFVSEALANLSFEESIAHSDEVELKRFRTKNYVPTIFCGKNKENNKLFGMKIPERTPLKCKFSLRCNHCDHLVYKPESKPNIISPRLALFGYLYLPQVQVGTVKEETRTILSMVVRPSRNDIKDKIENVLLATDSCEDNGPISEMVRDYCKDLSLNILKKETRKFENAEGDQGEELSVVFSVAGNLDLIPFRVQVSREEKKINIWMCLVFSDEYTK